MPTKRLLDGTRVQSRMNDRLKGVVVGYGRIKWPYPDKKDTTYGDTKYHLVYLVQVESASSSLGPACIVMRADRVEEVKE